MCRSTAALALALQVGSRMPLAASPIGRAFLLDAVRPHLITLASRLES